MMMMMMMMMMMITVANRLHTRVTSRISSSSVSHGPTCQFLLGHPSFTQPKSRQGVGYYSNTAQKPAGRRVLFKHSPNAGRALGIIQTAIAIVVSGSAWCLYLSSW